MLKRSAFAYEGLLPRRNPHRAEPEQISALRQIGPDLTRYDIDVDGATLTKRGTVTLPANVLYVWRPHGRGIFVSRRVTAPPGWARPATSTT